MATADPASQSLRPGMVLQKIVVSKVKSIFERGLVLPAEAVKKRNIQELARCTIGGLWFLWFIWFIWFLWFLWFI